MRILLPLRDIPIGSTVTKRGGDKEYIVQSSIRIYGEDRQRDTIDADEGTRFLLSKSGINAVNAVSADVEHLWVVDEFDLQRWLDDGYG